MEKGKLIVMEGACDGIGKSTQFELLRKHLIADGRKVVTHHFPSYRTYQGKAVEMYLQGEYGSMNELSPYFVNSLYAIDRAITWTTDLKRDYERGSIILLDRYTTSSIIYQASVIDYLDERRKFIDYVCDFEYHKLGIQEPDEVVFLTAPFDIVTKMRNARIENDGVENDIHERDLSFMKKVYDNAMDLSLYFHWDIVNCQKNGSLASIDEIHEKVYQKVKNHLD